MKINLKKPEFKKPEFKKPDVKLPSFKNKKDGTASDSQTSAKKPLVLTKRTRIIMLALGIAIIILLLVLGIAAYKHGEIYQEEFFPNTTINGIDCSNLTAKQAEAKLRESVENYQITIKFQDDDNVTFVGNSFGYSYVSDGSVQELIDAQSWSSWLLERTFAHDYELENGFSYNQETLRKNIMQLSEMKTSRMVAPQDACIVYQNDQYVVQPEVDGSTLVPDDVVNAVFKAVDANQAEVDLDAEGYYARPSVRSDDQLMNDQVEQLNSLANATINYTLVDGTTKSVTPELLRSWLSQDEAGNYYRDEAAFDAQIRNFVKEIADATDPQEDGVLFDTTADGTITVEWGEYSSFIPYIVDEETEYNNLKSLIDEHANTTREAAYTSMGSGIGNHGFGKTYAEVNLTSQHMWYYQDGEMVFDTDIVSGTMTTWRYTPEGAYLLYTKSSPHEMKGEVDPATNQPIYTVTCTYWMNIIPALGIGFHDYDYRDDWSTEAHFYGGSHGCINMHSWDAEELYSMIEVDTPVIMYYTDEPELEEEMSPAEKYAANGGQASTEDGENSDSEHSVAESTDGTENADQAAQTTPAAETVETGESTESTENADAVEAADSGGEEAVDAE